MRIRRDELPIVEPINTETRAELEAEQAGIKAELDPILADLVSMTSKIRETLTDTERAHIENLTKDKANIERKLAEIENKLRNPNL